MTQGPSRRRPLTAEESERVREAMPLAEMLARRMMKKHPALRFEDYLSLGYEALCDAVLLYSPEKGPFPGYAWAGITGAMFDGLSKHVAEQPERLVSRLFAAKAADPTEDRVTDPFADSDEDQLARARRRARNITFGLVTGLCCATWQERGEEGLVQQAERVHATAELERTREKLREEEDTLLDLHFHEGLPWGKVAAALGETEGATKSRAARILKKLAAELEAREVDGAPPVEDG